MCNSGKILQMETSNILYINYRTWLLSNTIAVLYTPEREHFGIVPIEAMYNRAPIIACNSGGPKESILDGQTGHLCDSNAQHWS